MTLRSLWQLFPLLAFAHASNTHSKGASSSDVRVISQVVTLLQQMLDASKQEADTERDLYAKYKCYCDTNEKDKSEEIDKLKTEIGMLQAKIEELLASNGVLSKDVAQLRRDKEANNQSQTEATAVRTTENNAFVAYETDMTSSLTQLDDAITELARVGGDQTVSVGTAHKQYMANFTALTSLHASVKQALIAASAFVTPKQAARVEALLQGPSFTGAYTSQSGEVVGILKDMRDTFNVSLREARRQEAKALRAYNRFMKHMDEAWASMDKEETEKNNLLASNDLDLSDKKGLLTFVQSDLSDAETFLASLLKMGAAKKKQYKQRVALRTTEDAALSEAIAILNSDAAFETFGTVNATKESLEMSFLQYRSIRKHSLSSASETARKNAQAFLQKAAGPKGHPMLIRVVAMLQANNPFSVVLEEIDKMIALIAQEERADDEQKQWCDTERTETSSNIGIKAGQITTLTGQINSIDQIINDPEVGLKVSIDNDEQALIANHESQVSETETRRSENEAYQKDIANLVEAQSLLSRALVVLERYYDKILGKSFVQENPTQPAPPQTWDDKYVGQSSEGTNAIGMLKFIQQNTKQEEELAHTDEMSAQHAYEDSMQTLKSNEKSLQTSLASLKEILAKQEQELLEKQKSLSVTEKEKVALEAYLEKIKPGCDFITTNIDTRKANRNTETTALRGAKQMLKDSPVYKEAMSAAHDESLGDCLGICQDMGEDHVECKACLAKVSVPGYCAGHPGVSGC